MQALIVNLLMKALRHGLTAYGLNEFLAGDKADKLAGALTFLVGFAWSIAPAIYAHWKQGRQKAA